ncbi:mucin-13 [Apus apus]|uniref:mucin-13 n=1 Tax=Apus apus TaxID=8895 RepID=UPI0021F86CF1|nr:mucin-13 [Apus apus]
MRRSVLLAVLLSLLLSLSKGEGSDKPETTSAPITSTTAGEGSDKPGTTSAPITSTTAGEGSDKPETTSAPITSTTAGEGSDKPGTTSAPITTTTAGEGSDKPETTSAPITSTTAGEGSDKPGTTSAPITTTTAGEGSDKPGTTSAPITTTTAGEGSDKPETTSAPITSTTAGEGSDKPETTSAPITSTTAGEGSDKPGTTSAPITSTTAGEGSGTPGTTSAPTTTTTAARNFCYPDPCGETLAQCLSLNTSYSCQCPYGFYYSEKDCHTGKTFSGFIILKEKYSEDVYNISSAEYEKVFQKIQGFFQVALKSLGLEQTIIVKIQPQNAHRDSDSINVTVTNLFVKTSDANKKKINDAIIKEIDSNPSYDFEYKGTTNCVAFGCDLRTTECTGEETPECVCKKDFSKTKWDVRSCSDCSENCSSQENEYCAIEKEVPVCKCAPSFQREGETCVACPVGYSGENCSDNTELSLIIVGTVLGAVILILVITAAVISVRAKHKRDPEKRSLIKQGYSNYEDGQTTVFPRVRTTSGHANAGYQPNNPYEMRSTNRGQFPERDYEDSKQEKVLLSAEPSGDFAQVEALKKGRVTGSTNGKKAMELSVDFYCVQSAAFAGIPPPPLPCMAD